MKKMRVLGFFVLFLFITSCYKGYDLIIKDESNVDDINYVEVISDNEICSADYKYINSSNIELNALVDERYIFRGWELRKDNYSYMISTQESCILNLKNSSYRDYVSNGELKIYAKFEKATRVSYKVSGGKFKTEPEKYCDTINGSVELPTNIEKKGYYFVGWEDEKGNIVTKIPQGKNKDVVLTAKWVHDVRDSLVNRVWSVSLLSTDFMYFDISYNLTFEFIDNEYVNVYAKIDDSYVNLGERYFALIHYLSKFNYYIYNDVRVDYNEWDFGVMEFNEYYFKYKLCENYISIYLYSENEEYEEIIDICFDWDIFRVSYSDVSNTLSYLPYSYDEENYNSFIEKYYLELVTILSGNVSDETIKYQIMNSDPVLCNEVTDNWSNIFKLCSSDIGDINNKSYFYQDSTGIDYEYILSISNNIFLPAFHLDETSEYKRYAYDSLVGLRNSLIITQDIGINKDDKLEMCMFIPIFGICFSTNDIDGYYGSDFTLNETTDGFYVTIDNETTFYKEITKLKEEKIYWYFSDEVYEIMLEVVSYDN